MFFPEQSAHCGHYNLLASQLLKQLADRKKGGENEELKIYDRSNGINDRSHASGTGERRIHAGKRYCRYGGFSGIV
jgi:hypothetical protein